MIPNFIWKNKHEKAARENVRRHRSLEGELALPDVQGLGRYSFYESTVALEKEPAQATQRRASWRAGGSTSRISMEMGAGGCFLSERKMHCSKQGTEITGSQPAGKNKTESLPHPLYPNRFQMEPTFKQTTKKK